MLTSIRSREALDSACLRASQALQDWYRSATGESALVMRWHSAVGAYACPAGPAGSSAIAHTVGNSAPPSRVTCHSQAMSQCCTLLYIITRSSRISPNTSSTPPFSSNRLQPGTLHHAGRLCAASPLYRRGEQLKRIQVLTRRGGGSTRSPGASEADAASSSCAGAFLGLSSASTWLACGAKESYVQR